MTVKRKKIEVVDWSDLEDEFNRLAEKKYGKKRDLRNWAGKTWDKAGDDVPYQDFWHVMCDSGVMPGNDSISEIDFDEWYQDYKHNLDEGEIDEEDKWHVEVLELLAKAAGKGTIAVRYSW